MSVNPAHMDPDPGNSSHDPGNRSPGRLKLKVCGMKENTGEIARLQPDYLGFIFWEGSSRYFEGEPPGDAAGNAGRVGVFVNADPSEILERTRDFDLSFVQLHGSETPGYCNDLKAFLDNVLARPPALIKAFAVGADFDFGPLEAYRRSCDFFLFDSRGPLPGGNGTGFNWEILGEYPYDTPFFLSGGIGPDALEALQAFAASDAGKHCHAIDVNSKFEIAPGKKDAGALERFMAASPWLQGGSARH